MWEHQIKDDIPEGICDEQIPFERVGIDLIGTFHQSAQGYHFVVVLVKSATQYPEALPVHTISTKCMAQALFQVLYRVGIPKEILVDQDTLFMSRKLKELLGIKFVWIVVVW